MNIQEAKIEIIRTFHAYMKQTADGSYRIPIEKQRPVLLIGPPGIGKTALMEQIATEEAIGLVSYTMTHHTRQSAVGLPLIQEKEYGGKTYSATEYTMSEIIASIYDYMRETGKTQGILFLDEINCVSETLSPVMLQLLQNKTFGSYSIPKNWIIVAAGNPPEYNKSVRELDMATLDRVKHMEIEADLSVWMDYAFTHEIHPSVTAYLTLHPEHFYQIQDMPRGQLFVTARGWEDLSCMIRSYEEDGISVPEYLMIQYLQHDEIARSFYLFYDLFRHFTGAIKRHVQEVENPADIIWQLRLEHVDISHGLALASHLMAGVRRYALHWQEQTILEKELEETLTAWSQKSEQETENAWQAVPLLVRIIESRRTALKIKEEKQLAEKEDSHKEQIIIRTLETLLQTLKIEKKADRETACQKATYLLQETREQTQLALNCLTEFVSHSYRLLETFPGDEPLLYFTADLTAEPDCAEPLTSCPEYRRHAERLLLVREENALRKTLISEKDGGSTLPIL